MRDLEVRDNEHDADGIWTTCAPSIRAQLSDAVWKANFSGARAVAFASGELVLVVPNGLQKSRIEGRYLGLVRDALEETAPGVSDVTIRVEIETDRTEIVPEMPAPAPRAKNSEESRFTFDHFVIGTSNRFAHAAALSVAEQPATAYNPLFIYGHSGLGKTHLLQAIHQYVVNHYPTYQARYVTSETFLNEFIEAIRMRKLSEFKLTYRKIDVLLVDDIQFIEGKEGFQEEFFHTFNELYQNDKQIVLSSDRAPDAIPTLEGRLRSRFKSGLITDIQPPDPETRLAILRKQRRSSTIEIGDDILDYIATHITDSIRELEGALIKVKAYSNLIREPCTLDMARRLLADLINEATKPPVTANTILEHTAELFDFSIDKIIGGSRRRPLVDARQIGMYVTRTMTDLSFPEIGKIYGNRDHTTVMHAVRKIENHMGERREVFDQVQQLRRSVSNGFPTRQP